METDLINVKSECSKCSHANVCKYEYSPLRAADTIKNATVETGDSSVMNLSRYLEIYDLVVDVTCHNFLKLKPHDKGGQSILYMKR